MKILFLSTVVLFLSGCSTIVDGKYQSVFVDSDPQGASCIASKLGTDIAAVNPTPGAIMLERGPVEIVLVCSKDGYYTSTGVINSHYNSTTLGNILLGGVVGIVIDAASGAQSKYDASVKVVLEEIREKDISGAIDEIMKN